MNTNKVVFRSRISVLLLSFILVLFLFTFNRGLQTDDITGIYVSGGSLLIVLFLITKIRYIIAGNDLIIKLGFVSIAKIDIHEIALVKRSYNPLSSPAASLKRLALYRCGKSNFIYALISPAKEQEFIEKLKTVNPDIKVNVPVKKGFWYILDWDI
ncbi:MAG: PH domain-containing protein [Bacteroidales bacterium]